MRHELARLIRWRRERWRDHRRARPPRPEGKCLIDTVERPVAAGDRNGWFAATIGVSVARVSLASIASPTDRPTLGAKSNRKHPHGARHAGELVPAFWVLI